MDLNKEMLELANRWAVYNEEEQMVRSDFLVGAGKAVAVFTTNLLRELSDDDLVQQEFLENYLANIERLTMHLLKKCRETEDG